MKTFYASLIVVLACVTSANAQTPAPSACVPTGAPPNIAYQCPLPAAPVTCQVAFGVLICSAPISASNLPANCGWKTSKLVHEYVCH